MPERIFRYKLQSLSKSKLLGPALYMQKISFQNVNLRVEIMDEDFLGKYDLIEQFECKFFPAVADQPVNQFAADPDTFKSWTLMEECAAKHLPAKIR